MNLKELNNKNYLQSLLNDKEQLNAEIEKTGGYVLYLMEQENLLPKKEDLLEQENVFALNFILKHYELEKAEIKKLKKYFSDHSSKGNQVTNEVLTLEEVEDYLIEEKKLNRNTILPLDILNKYVKEIDRQYYIDEYNMNHIMDSSIKKLTKEEILSLNKEFLLENISVFNVKPGYFSDDKYNALYKELLIEKAQNENKKLEINNFRNYHFKENDKEFLDQLLINSSHRYNTPTYGELSSIEGFTKLISKLEYFDKFGYKDVNDFTTQEFDDNIEIIRARWLQAFNEEKDRYYKNFNNFINFNASPSRFEKIFSLDYLSEVLDNIAEYHEHSMSRDDSESKDKMTHIERQLLSYAIKNKDNIEKLTKLELSSMYRNIYHDYDHDRHKLENESYKNDIAVFYLEVTPKLMHSDYMKEFLGYSTDYIVNEYSADVMLELAQSHPSVNLFALLAKSYNNNKKNFTSWKWGAAKKTLEKALNEVAKHIEPEDTKLIAKYYDAPVSKLIVRKNDANNNSENNILNYKDIAFEKLVENEFRTKFVFDLKKDFREMILKEKKELPEDVVFSILRNAEDDATALKFIKDYVKIHRENILKNDKLVKAISRNEKNNEILSLNNKDRQEHVFVEWITKLQQKNQLEKEQEALKKTFKKMPSDGYYHSEEEEEELLAKLPKEEKEKRQKVDQLYEQVQQLRKETAELLENLSHDFFNEKIIKLVKERNFDDVKLMKEASNHSLEYFYQYVSQLDFNELLKNIENDSFRSLIVNAINYDNKTAFKFNNYSERENTILAEMLMDEFPKDPLKITYFFMPKNRDFVKEFSIKNCPKEIFYSYKLRAKESISYNLKKDEDPEDGILVRTPYTVEQIWRAYRNLDKKEGFFSYMDVNAGFDHSFNANFKNDEEGYLALLEKAKEDPKFYAALCNSSIIDDFAKKLEDKSKERQTRDELSNEYVAKVFDINILAKGIKQILKDMKNASYEHEESESKFNRKLANQTIHRVYHLTHYEEYDSSYGRNGTYHTNLSQEQIDTIFHAVWEEAPLLFLSLYHVGTQNMAEYVEKNFDKLMNTHYYSANELLYTNDKIKNEYFGVDPSKGLDHGHNITVEKFIHAMIDYYTIEGKKEELDHMSYLLQQKKFFEDELSYDYKYKANQGNSLIIDYMSEKDDMQNKVYTTTRKFFLEQALSNKEITNKPKSRKI